jgi:hypothetical protein
MELLGDVGHVQYHFVSISLETVLVAVQESFSVSVKCTIGLEIILDAPDGAPR